jgi:tetratricopeptide (TPR) repeat protein
MVEETMAEAVVPDVSDTVQELAGVVLTDQAGTQTTNESVQLTDVPLLTGEESTTTAQIQAEEFAATEDVSVIFEIADQVISTENILVNAEEDVQPANHAEENLEASVAVVAQAIDNSIVDENTTPAAMSQPEGESLQAGNFVSLVTASDESQDRAVNLPVEEAEVLMPEPEPAEISCVQDGFTSFTKESSPDEIVVPEQAEQELLDDASYSIELSRLASAIAAYKKVTEINPENDRAWDSLGNLYRASERYGDAVSAFEHAISLRPNKEVYHYHLGLVYAAEKNYEDAIGAFQKVIELNPEYTFAHCALAGYFRKLGKEAEAQEHIEKALPKMTSEKEYDRACFSAICGNTDEAIELLKIALEKKQTSLDWVRRDPDLDFIRDDQRFKALLSQNGQWSEPLAEVFLKQLAWSPDK